MEIHFTKLFNKEISSINNTKIAQGIIEAIENVKSAKTPLEIRNLKKLKGYKNAFRIKLGDFRIGVYIDKNSVEFTRFLNRKDIYKYFP